MKKFRRFVEALTAMSFAVTNAVAQSATGGVKGIEAANGALQSYFQPLSTLILVIGAIVGLIGAVKVYGKFSQGDPDATKSLAAWGGACLFLVLAGTVLSSFFGVS